MTESSEDAAIQAVSADLTNVANAVQTSTATLANLIAQLEQEVSNGDVQPSTVTALQNVQAQLDAASSALATVANPPPAS